MYRRFSQPLETFRTCPVQIIAITGCLINAAVVTSVAFERGAPSNLIDYSIAGFNIAAALFNAALAESKIGLRDRVESALDRNGFDERILSTTTKAYCSRQATLIACENYGVADEYTALCEQNSENNSLTWLPQI